MRFTFRSIALCFIAAAIHAQSDRGAITGTVTDPANGVIPNAAVVAANSHTGAQYQTVTAGIGNYTLPSLPAGVYNVSVEVAGFKKLTRRGVRVEVAQTARVELALQVGAALTDLRRDTLPWPRRSTFGPLLSRPLATDTNPPQTRSTTEAGTRKV